MVQVRILFLATLVALLCGYWVVRQGLPAPEIRPGEGERLEWLAREFGLSVETMSEIRRLQELYGPVCAGHCEAIAEAERKLAQAAPSERAAAEAELQRLHVVCATATRAHLQSLAALMPPHAGQRFLRLMEPRIAHQPGQTTAPSLDGAP